MEYVWAGFNRVLSTILQVGDVPEHIGFVMDGNRRFARKREQETKEGHNAGYGALRDILDFAYRVGVKEVTVYAFSIENFKRPAREVDGLMDLARTRLLQLCDHGDLAQRYGAQIRIVGDVSRLPRDVQDVCKRVETLTATNDECRLNICMPYTSRDDLAHAMRKISETQPEKINADIISQNLYTAGIRPLDLLIRTSGTNRLSDFLLWEIQDYPETTVEFCDVLWPQYSPWHLFNSILRWNVLNKTEQAAQ